MKNETLQPLKVTGHVGKHAGRDDVLMVGVAPVGKRVYGNAAAGCEDAFDLDIFRVHEADEVFHYYIHAIFVKVAVIAEAEKI